MISRQEIEDEGFIACTLCSSGTCPNAEGFELKEKGYTPEPQGHHLLWAKAIEIEGLRPQTSLTKSEELWVHRALTHPTESAFDEREDIKSKKIQKLLNDVREKSDIPYAHEIADKLTNLFEIVNEDPDEDLISIDSMISFISFLKYKANLKCPDISLTPSNDIHAQWRVAPNRLFAAIFLPSGKTQFVVFKPNSNNPNKTDRFWGITSVDELMKTVQPLSVLEWASQ